MSDRDRVIATIGKDLADQVGDVIVDYITMSVPPFTGTEDEFFELIWPFLDGETDEATARQLCHKLLQQFDKIKKDVPVVDDASKLAGPIKMSDLFSQVKEEKVPSSAESVNPEYLFGPAGKKKEKAAKKTSTANAPISSPTTFFVSRGDKSKQGLGRDVHIDSVDISIGSKCLVKNSYLKLTHGRRYGLVGRNGMGKSTLLRYISGRELRGIPDHLQILHVEQEVIGDDVSVLDTVLSSDVERLALLDEEKELLAKHKTASEEEQKELDTRLSKVYADLADIASDEAESKARLILGGLGFTSEMQKQATKEFSGGWRMRVSLARALFCTPDILLLDEPTNMLDVRAVLWLEAYLCRWKHTLLVVSHDRDFLNEIATDIIHLDKQELTPYNGNYEAFVRARIEALKNQQRIHDAQAAQIKHISAFVDRFRYNANRAALVQSRLKKLEKMTLVPEVLDDPTLNFTFPNPTELRPPLIQFKDVDFGYNPEKPPLFKNLNFAIDMDSRVALVGSNGQGKTTLLNLVFGEIHPTKGILFRHGRLRIAKFSQHHVDQLNLNLTPVEFLQSKHPGREVQEYRAILGRYALSGDVALQKIETLSGGQKSRVVFAHIAMIQPQIMVLDEPVNHLDIETVDALAQALNQFTGGIVLISHDERLISAVCDEIWIVNNGTVNRWEGDFDSYKAHLMKEFAM